MQQAVQWRSVKSLMRLRGGPSPDSYTSKHRSRRSVTNRIRGNRDQCAQSAFREIGNFPGVTTATSLWAAVALASIWAWHLLVSGSNPKQLFPCNHGYGKRQWACPRTLNCQATRSTLDRAVSNALQETLVHLHCCVISFEMQAPWTQLCISAISCSYSALLCVL